MFRSWKCTLRVTQHQTKLLLSAPEGHLLRAQLDTQPCHPRALLTLLEGLSLWGGETLRVALCVDDGCRASHGSMLFGDELWPGESPLVRYDIVHPVRRRARLAGLGSSRAPRRVVPHDQ
jgi:hypothetical protein